MPRRNPVSPTPIPAAVANEVDAFRKIFISKPPFVSGVYPIDQLGYRLYYGDAQSAR